MSITKDDILKLRDEVITAAKEEELRSLQMSIRRYDLRIKEIKYELEHGSKVPINKDDRDAWRYLYEKTSDNNDIRDGVIETDGCNDVEDVEDLPEKKKGKGKAKRPLLPGEGAVIKNELLSDNPPSELEAARINVAALKQELDIITLKYEIALRQLKIIETKIAMATNPAPPINRSDAGLDPGELATTTGGPIA